jgi:hypothetical protein
MLGKMKRVGGAATVGAVEFILLLGLYIVGAWWMESLGAIEWYWAGLIGLPFVLGFVLSRKIVQRAMKKVVAFLGKKKRWLKALGVTAVFGLAGLVAWSEIQYGFITKHDVEAFILGGTLGLIGLCFLLGYITYHSEYSD